MWWIALFISHLALPLPPSSNAVEVSRILVQPWAYHTEQRGEECSTARPEEQEQHVAPAYRAHQKSSTYFISFFSVTLLLVTFSKAQFLPFLQSGSVLLPIADFVEEKMALPCLDTEPVVWVAQLSACCMPLVMPLGHVILGLGKGFFKDFESFFFIHFLLPWSLTAGGTWRSSELLCSFLFVLPVEKKMGEVGGKANRRWEGMDIQELNIKTRNI